MLKEIYTFPLKALGILFLLSMLAQQAFGNPVSIKQILSTKSGWDGAPLPGFNTGITEIRVSTFKLAPGSKTSIHLHPVNGAGYVISGELTMHATKDPQGSFTDPKNVKEITLKAGEAWAETVNTWHYGENKQSKDVEFVLIFAAQEGTPSTLSTSSK